MGPQLNEAQKRVLYNKITEDIKTMDVDKAIKKAKITVSTYYRLKKQFLNESPKVVMHQVPRHYKRRIKKNQATPAGLDRVVAFIGSPTGVANLLKQYDAQQN